MRDANAPKQHTEVAPKAATRVPTGAVQYVTGRRLGRYRTNSNYAHTQQARPRGNEETVIRNRRRIDETARKSPGQQDPRRRN